MYKPPTLPQKVSTVTDPSDEESVRQMLDAHLSNLGFSRNGNSYILNKQITKPGIRQLHAAQRLEILRSQKALIEQHGDELITHFASGQKVDPSSIDPELVEVTARTSEARLFRFATLLWSVPVSQGFGRRLRFLVRDRQNGCLIGLFGIGDPVFNLNARDQWIGWTHADRAKRLVHIMDAFVVGAVPPYSQLIGGKLVAALMASVEVVKKYEHKYAGKKAVISGKSNNAPLVLLTTTSALGRSSLYNRLSMPGGFQFIRIGKTKGFGHFHLGNSVFEALRAFLKSRDHPYASGHRFGMGPNWKMRVIRAALGELGLDGNGILRHGIEREVFILPLAKNYRDILLGETTEAHSLALPMSEIADYCQKRWIIPRAERDRSYTQFIPETLLHAFLD